MRVTKVEEMTLGNFRVTETNAEYFKMCEALVLDPDAYRLAFICIPADERQHLKYALIHGFSEMQDMLCVSMDEYISDLVSAIKKGKNSVNLSKYTEPKTVLIDDLQLLKGKDQTQEFFYRVLKQRLENKKVTILFSEYGLDHLRRTFRDDLLNYLNLGCHTDEE